MVIEIARHSKFHSMNISNYFYKGTSMQRSRSQTSLREVLVKGFSIKSSFIFTMLGMDAQIIGNILFLMRGKLKKYSGQPSKISKTCSKNLDQIADHSQFSIAAERIF